MVVSLMDLTISETKCRREKALRPLRFAEKPPLVVARASQRVYMCHMSFGRKQEVLQVRQPIRSSTVKRLIVVLAILLALSLAALCAVRYYGRQAGRAAEAPGNGIQTAAQPAGAPVPTAARTGKVTIRLYDRSPEYNREFSVTNMFPGDAETQNDCVQVDHKGDVTVHFRAEVRPGYEKLAEVLKLRVSVGGSVLYDGLMAEMPAAVDTPLSAGSDTLDYQLTAYLDTSVGNPYMYQQLVADFYWWVADSEELAPPTGDTMQPLLWGAAVLVSGAALTVLLRRRREVSHD